MTLMQDAEASIAKLHDLLRPLGFDLVRREVSEYWGRIVVTYQRRLVRVTAVYSRRQLGLSVEDPHQQGADLDLWQACLGKPATRVAQICLAPSNFEEDVAVLVKCLPEIEAALEANPGEIQDCLRATGAARFASMQRAELIRTRRSPREP